jgi:broad-specificity NMP kinase
MVIGKKTICEALHFLRLEHIRFVLAFTLVELLTGKDNPWNGDSVTIKTDAAISHGHRCVGAVDDSRCVTEISPHFVGTDALESDSRADLDWPVA